LGRASVGLTLVEAVAALALLALLLAVAVPNLLPAAELEARVAGRQVAADAFLAGSWRCPRERVTCWSSVRAAVRTPRTPCGARQVRTSPTSRRSCLPVYTSRAPSGYASCPPARRTWRTRRRR
jgi:hypothetical protein